MRLAGGILVFVMLAAACGSSEPETEAISESTTATTTITTTTASTTPTTEAPPETIGIEGLDELVLVSSVSAGKMIDIVRPDAVLRHGLAADGDQPLDSRPDGRFFTGDDDDVLVNSVGEAESETLNPNGSLFAFEVHGLVLLDPTYNKIQTSTERLSWNVMQRGLAGNVGGQWKMSLVNEADGSVNPQCVVRDEENRFMRVNATVEILPNEPIRVTCILDDSTNQLSVAVNGDMAGTSRRVRKAVGGQEEVVDEEFGDSNPNGGATCAGLVESGIGNLITVGNKPACGATLTDDDRFQGEISVAKVWKR